MTGGNAQSKERVKDEPVLTASQSLTEHPQEIKQEDRVPELAKTIRECGIWPRHRPLDVFWTPAVTRADLMNSMRQVKTPCLGSRQANRVE